MVACRRYGRRAALLSSLIMVLSVATAVADEKTADKPTADLPSRKLSAGELQVVNKIKADPRLNTKFQGKENPGDRETWFVINFTDIAVAETKQTSANGMAGGFTYSPTRVNKQKKVTNHAVVVQGRTDAAVAVMDYANLPNQAAAKIAVGTSKTRPGGFTSRETKGAADRAWNVRAFDNEGEARRFYEELTKPKK